MIKKLSIFLILLLTIPYAAIANQFWYTGGGGGGGDVPSTRLIDTAAPLNGGGDLSSDRTLGMDLSGVAAGSYVNAAFTVDQFGLLTLASSGVGLLVPASTAAGQILYADGAGGYDHTEATEVWWNDTTKVFNVETTLSVGPIKLNNTWISNDGDAEGLSINDDGSVTLSGGHFVNVSAVTAATYDLIVSDYIVSVEYTSTAAVTSLTIPTAQTIAGRNIVVTDTGGLAGTNSITIDTEGGELINGVATFVVNTNYQSVLLWCNGADWFAK